MVSLSRIFLSASPYESISLCGVQQWYFLASFTTVDIQSPLAGKCMYEVFIRKGKRNGKSTVNATSVLVTFGVW